MGHLRCFVFYCLRIKQCLSQACFAYLSDLCANIVDLFTRWEPYGIQELGVAAYCLLLQPIEFSHQMVFSVTPHCKCF